jgi:hypothetical protein
MNAPTRRQLMACSLAAIGAAGAPAMAGAATPHTPPTEEDWRRLFAAIRRLTPEQFDDVLAAGRAMLREQGIEP